MILVTACLNLTGCSGTQKATPTSPGVEIVQASNSVINSFEKELSNSPRHQEWVTLRSGDREFQAFVVYPERSSKTKSVIVIHENRGLDDWARLFADKLAGEGYLVIAPDLISNTKGKKEHRSLKVPMLQEMLFMSWIQPRSLPILMRHLIILKMMHLLPARLL